MIGGGSRNAFLNQLTADTLGVPVVAGPVECTAAGNVMVQAQAAGEVADLADMRLRIADSIATTRYEPDVTVDVTDVYTRFVALPVK